MAGFVQKVLLKLKFKLRPSGYSRIKKGYGSGIYWTHAVSDMRYLSGEYEPQLASWLKTKMEAGFSFIDIGANAGYFSLLASKYATSKSQRILAVEPFAENLALIRKHVHKNQNTQIEIVPFAIADTNRTVEFSATENFAANTYNAASALHQNAPKISLEAKSLDSLCAEKKMSHFVVKIDVEGAELDVLKGAISTLTNEKPELILATHDCHVKGIERDCLNFISNLGYQCTPIEDEKFVEGQRDYLCIHAGK